MDGSFIFIRVSDYGTTPLYTWLNQRRFPRGTDVELMSGTVVFLLVLMWCNIRSNIFSTIPKMTELHDGQLWRET